METIASLEKEISCRVTNSTLKYLESLGYNIDSIVEGLPYSREYLMDPFNWVTCTTRETIFQRAAELAGNEAIMYHVGLATPKLNPLGGIETIVRLLGNPKVAYKNVPRYANYLDKTLKFQSSLVDSNKVVVTMSLPKGYAASKCVCYYAQGILAAIPVVWGLPPAEIYEKQCIFQHGDEHGSEEVKYGAETCIYEITWQPRMRPWYSKLIGQLFRSSDRAISAASEVERKLLSLDEKNQELLERYSQLAKVREIALSLDTVRAIGEILRLVVDSAMDIRGMRFVAVQRIDESGDIIIPYYSRIRDETIDKALKALSFALDKQLGKMATGEKLQLPPARLKVAQDYLSNPRVIVKERLSELMDGVLDKTLCDSIQRIADIKKFVIVPLFVGSESWGALVFSHEGSVPQDILEMVGAHCAMALKNASILESIERRNEELAALNVIAKQTSSSLELAPLLHSTLEEAVRIFVADAAAIYLLDKNSRALDLVAHCGMPEEMIVQSESIQIDGSSIGKFFTSDEEILVADLHEYPREFPVYSSLALKELSLPFATAVIYSRGHRFGMMTVIRKGKERFQNNEQSLLLSISNQVSVAIENARLHGDVLARMKETELANNNLETAVKSLAESEEKLRLIIESVAEGIIVSDMEGTIMQANEFGVNMHAYHNREELIGLSSFDLIAKKDHARAIKNLKKTLEEGHVKNIDYTFLTKDGREFDAELSAVVLRDASDSPIGFVASTRDITERKRTESELRAQKELTDRILASTPNSVLVIDRGLYIILANKTFCETFKVKRDEVEGRQLADIVLVTDLHEALSRVFTGRKLQLELEFKYKITTTERILVANIIPMREEECLLILQDVTEERERQERLYLTDRLASVGEMASGIAHELNNPLTGVIGLSQLLLDSGVPDDIREDVTSIHSEGQRAAAVVKNFLSFARRHEPVKRATQINSVIEDMLQLRGYEHRINNIKVNTRFVPELPEVMVDYFQMQQVFLNIIINAEIAMIESHSGGTLTIATQKANDMVRVSFTDDGPGITEETLGRIFDPFFTTKEVGKGTGLGLSICHGIVAGHGGKIHAESELGKGAAFIVELPVDAR